MKRRYFVIFSLFILLLFSSIYLFAQMADWKFFRDREGNVYYYDRALKIRITDEKFFDFTPASINGTDYYLHKGIEIIKSGKYAEGLFYLKSLKTLPMNNLRVRNNAKEASKWINYLQKKHGPRYERFDRESTILLNFNDGSYNLVNEKLRYKIILKQKPKVIRALWKLNDAGYGFKFGFNLDNQIENEKSQKDEDNKENFEIVNSENNDGEKDSGYDCIVGIETRILKGNIKNIKEAEESWRNEFGKDNFKREEVLQKEDRIIYLYTYNDGVPFSGIEGVFINGKFIHIVRTLCSNSIKDRVFQEIRKPVEALILVR